MIKENNSNMDVTSQSKSLKEKKEKVMNNPKVKEMQEKEFQKRQSREQDIQHEREHGDINQASE